MSSLPDASDLLTTAREALLRRLLPALPEALHYEARMIANAMAIAARECQTGAPAGGVRERELAEGIRDGQHAGDAIWQELLTITRRKLAVSNPRVLGAYPEGE